MYSPMKKQTPGIMKNNYAGSGNTSEHNVGWLNKAQKMRQYMRMQMRLGERGGKYSGDKSGGKREVNSI